MATPSSYHDPCTVAVVGAGAVGLSCAWFLARAGVRVIVVEQSAVAAGASAGNAGWVTPGLATPLVSRVSLRQGARGLWDRRQPVLVPLSAALRSPTFLAGFAVHSRTIGRRTPRRRSMR